MYLKCFQNKCRFLKSATYFTRLLFVRMFLPTQVLLAKSQDFPAGQVLKALHPATQAGALLQYCPTGQPPTTHPEIE